MKKKIVCFVHTEYHLLLFINKLINDKQAGINNQYVLCLRVLPSSRFAKHLNLDSLPVEVRYVDDEFNFNKPLVEKSKTTLKQLLGISPDEFIFFQEMDLLMAILCNVWGKNNKTQIKLYQDGLKPYNLLKFNSLGLIKHFHQTNVWLKKNGFPIDSWFSPLWSHRYAFSKSIDEVHLTFPKAYINWNKKPLYEISFKYKTLLEKELDHVFNWQDKFLPHAKDLILYMNQQLHDDGKLEYDFIRQLKDKFPQTEILIKTHPLTPSHMLERYKNIAVHIIDQPIPAELFIMKISRSIIISQSSTSMFINNESNAFYYLHQYFGHKIKRMRRYKIPNHPARHIKLVQTIDDITF